MSASSPSNSTYSTSLNRLSHQWSPGRQLANPIDDDDELDSTADEHHSPRTVDGDPSLSAPKSNRQSKPKTAGLKRKKANRACFHCQKCHLTCDDERPCQRCIKKGLADSCQDGVRKKAKYLLTEEELQALKDEKVRKAQLKAIGKSARSPVALVAGSSSSASPSSSSPPKRFQPDVALSDSERIISASEGLLPPMPPSVPQMLLGDTSSGGGGTGTEPTFSLPTDAAGGYGFGSEATSLEYNLLSSMLSDIDPALLGRGTPDLDPSGSHTSLDDSLSRFDMNPPPPAADVVGGAGAWKLNPAVPPNSEDHHYGGPQIRPLPPGGPAASADRYADAAATSFVSAPPPDLALDAAPHARPRLNGIFEPMQSAEVWKERVAHVYGDQMRPFRYTEGYHFLLKHCTENFQKADVLRIVRALAIFRPSLIALQMPLTEDDEIFVERSLQRTVLELEKLISFSGTPTVVWRRTCEICVVGAEFSMLTQWSREHLMGKYVYQFFDKESTLNYWETFALHAFDSGRQSVVVKCVLLTPTGRKVPCSACFSIKRDIFDLPSLVVGNFLPILS